MRIVLGRGNGRKAYDIPCAAIINRSDEKEVSALVANVCQLAGIK